MNIRYTNDALIITLPCGDPAATHALLLQSINSVVKYSAASEDKEKNFGDQVIPLLNLQQILMPGEEDLQKIV
jgi:hypothetical protein